MAESRWTGAVPALGVLVGLVMLAEGASPAPRRPENASQISSRMDVGSILSRINSYDLSDTLPVDEYDMYSPWGKWSKCKRDCVQRRVRRCLHNATCDPTVLKEERSCWRKRGRCAFSRQTRRQVNTTPSEDIVYELLYYDWSEWSPCMRNCKRKRVRTCQIRRLCKHLVIREEQACAPPGSSCERKAEEAGNKGSTEQETGDKMNGGGEDKRPGRTKPRPDEDVEPIQVDWDPGECGVTNVTGSLRIVGGHQARPGAWPWQVAIMTRWKEQYCGGVLISPYHVLTAAHCLRRKGRKRRVLVRVSEYDLSAHEGHERDLRVAKDYVHHDFDLDTIDSDIAVLRLRTPVLQGSNLAYACVPKSTEVLPTHTHCFAVGWGKMRDTDLYGAHVLRQAEVPLVAEDKCQHAFDYDITENQMCAGFHKGGVDTCAGDSGGPLMCLIERAGVRRWVVYGVTSFGEGCGDRGKYGIYTKVTNFASWIQRIVDEE